MNTLKPLHEWSFDYLKSLPSEEQDWLEYKGSDWILKNNKWTDQITKYISAFSNYGGGFLIVGLTHNNETASFEFDGGLPSNAQNNMNWNEWLEDLLPASMDPPVTSIKVRYLKNPESENSGVLVIYTPESILAPHQAKDHCYYHRVGSKTHPLRNRAIQDIFNRITNPELDLIACVNTRYEWDANPSNASLCLHNNGRILCKRYSLCLNFPPVINNLIVDFQAPYIPIVHIDKNQLWLQIRIESEGSHIAPGDKRIIQIPFRLRSGHFKQIDERVLYATTLQARLFADSARVKEYSFEIESIANPAKDLIISK